MSNVLKVLAAGSPSGAPWDISGATYNGSPVNFISVLAQESDACGIHFKSDGTKMYITGNTSDAVHEYNLSVAWDVGSASFLQSFSVSAQELSPTDLFFKPDGTKMYVLGSNGDEVNEYDLSSAWNISTASYLQTFSVSAQEASPNGFFFKPDGTKMYVIGQAGDDVNEYDLSTAWDISTASYLQNFSVAAQDTGPRSVWFKSDGTKMFMLGTAGMDVNEYALSSAWDVSSATYTQNFSIVAEEGGGIMGFAFKDDGTRMYLVGNGSDQARQYDLSSAWDISSESYTNPSTDYFNFSTQDTVTRAIFFKPDGTKMFMLGDTGNDVNEYDLSSAWDISTASFVRAKAIADIVPHGLFFKDDGTKMYVLGVNNDTVYEYDLSTAWNISTTSLLNSFSVAGQEINPTGLAFKDDGTKMYVTGATGVDINEYDLSTGWDISSATYSTAFSFASQEAMTDVYFRPDGTKMYTSGNTSNKVFEYDLGTAWSVGSATFLQDFSVANLVRDAQGVFFKDDGTKLYVLDRLYTVYSFDL